MVIPFEKRCFLDDETIATNFKTRLEAAVSKRLQHRYLGYLSAVIDLSLDLNYLCSISVLKR